MKFLIIGADAAGMSAAGRAKRTQPDMDVRVLEKTGDVSYSACGMPYNIADSQRDIDDLVVRPAEVFRQKQGIDLLTGHEALKIDPVKQVVTGVAHGQKDFSYGYDHLLIATGGRPIAPDLPGFDLPGVMALKSLDDGRNIKHFIRDHAVEKAVVIGMGYIGLEMAEALRGRDIAVDMIKPNPVFLPWMAVDLAAIVQQELSANGVKLHLGQDVTAIEKTQTGLAVISPSRTLDADLALVAIGIYPNSELAAAAGLPLGAGHAIAVDQNLRTSVSNIYAAGDCADARHVVTGKPVWVPLALRANRAGWAVADNVCGKNAMLDGIAGTAVFKVFDLQVARTGLTSAQARHSGFEPVDVTIKTRSRAHAHPGAGPIWVHMIGDKSSGRLLGAQMVGREGVAHRINAAAVALHARMSVAAFAQTDLAYAPPFGPTWDPLLTAANQLLKKM